MNGDKKFVKEEARVQSIGRGSRLYLQQNENPRLRRPHYANANPAAGESELISPNNVTQPESTQTPETKQSTLSVNAPEFIPRSCQQSSPTSSQDVESCPITNVPQKHSVQDRINIARELPSNMNIGQVVSSQDTSQLCNNNTQNPQVYSYNSYNSVNAQEYSEDYENYCREQEAPLDKEDLGSDVEIFRRFEKIIIAVTSNPGNFDKLVPQFVSDFRKERRNLKYLRILVTTLIDWSVTESNFRYSGARFCTYFDTTSEMSNEKCFFRDALFYTCKLETVELEWQPSEDNQRKCYGLILFLAELVAQMDESFTSLISELLLTFMVKVLKKPTSDIIKYICQALKLVGPKLEKDRSKIEDVEEVMRLLSKVVIGDKVNKQVGYMVHNVHELRNSNWGASNSDSSGMNTAPLQQVQQASDEPGTSNHLSRTDVAPLEQELPNESLVYGPDGPIALSAEESKFLQDHLNIDNEEYVSVEEFLKLPESLYDDDNDFDEEIEKAYEEFLRNIPSKKP